MTFHVTVLCLYLAIQAAELLFTTINLKHLAAHGNKVPLGFESVERGRMKAKIP